MILGKDNSKRQRNTTPHQLGWLVYKETQITASVVKDMQKLEPLGIGGRTVQLGGHHGKE